MGQAPAAFDIHVFLATGVAEGVKAAGGAASAGKRYSLLIFTRQAEGRAADKRLAREGAAAAGWKEVKLERSRVLSAGEAPGDPTLKAAFDEALRDGCAVLAYKKPLAPG